MSLSIAITFNFIVLFYQYALCYFTIESNNARIKGISAPRNSMKFYRGIIIRTFTNYNTIIILIAGLSQEFAYVLDFPVVIKLIGIIGNPSQFAFDASECALL